MLNNTKTASATIYFGHIDRGGGTTQTSHELAYEYWQDDAGVYHAVHRDGTPWRWDGDPVPAQVARYYSHEVAHQLPDEEHGCEWGDPVSADTGKETER